LHRANATIKTIMKPFASRHFRPLLLGLATSSLLAAPLAAQICNPLAVNTCAAPFPSDLWTQTDAASPTGVSVNFTNSLISANAVSEMPVRDGLTPEAIFKGASGWSAAGSVVFEFDEQPLAESLPARGGNAVVAWDLDDQRPIALNTWAVHNTPIGARDPDTHGIEVYPQTRWPYGHRILVAVTKSLAIPGQQRDFSALSGASAQTSGSAQQTAYLQDLNVGIAQAGLDPSQLWSATLFTVRDRQETIGPMLQKVQWSYEQPHPIRDLSVRYVSTDPDRQAVVTGEILLYSFRTGNTPGRVDFDQAPVDYWTPFKLTIPTAARRGPVPVAIYGHGLTTSRNIDIPVEPTNSSLGIATFGIDYPNHGIRSRRDGGYAWLDNAPGRIGKLVGLLNQSTIDLVGAEKALMTVLTNIDVVGRPSWTNWLGHKGDGVPDLDVTNLVAEGTSLGGFLNGTYAALSPNVDSALLAVAGSGFMNFLTRSQLWNNVGFYRYLPESASAVETIIIKNAIQHEIDPGDNIHYVDQLSRPDQPRPPRPLLMQVGVGDLVVPNDLSETMALLVGLDQVGTVYSEIPGLPQRADHGSGFSLIQYPPRFNPWLVGDNLTGSSSHIVFSSPEGKADMAKWLQRFVVER